MIDLESVDPATLQPGSELDTLIAEKWMGWRRGGECNRYWAPITGTHLDYSRSISNWSPSTNPAHAGEARRKAEHWLIETYKWIRYTDSAQGDAIRVELYPDEKKRFEEEWSGDCQLSEINGDKGAAEALATCRAIVAKLKAAEAVEVDDKQ